MAKIYGLFGAMTGKLADTVMAVRNGEQLARKYQPVVFNPNSPAQVAQRAKMKLMSQLSAVLAPAIAISREGSRSARNLFTKVNFGLTSFTNNEASINLNSVQLTKSVVGLPTIYAGRTGDNTIEVALNQAPSAGSLSRVVYVALAKQADGNLRYSGSQVATSTDGEFFPVSFGGTNEEVVFLAYGVRDNSDSARVAFGNLEAVTAEQVAKLVTSRTLTESDITLTETQGVTVPAVQTSIHSNPASSDDGNRSSKKK